MLSGLNGGNMSQEALQALVKLLSAAQGLNQNGLLQSLGGLNKQQNQQPNSDTLQGKHIAPQNNKPTPNNMMARGNNDSDSVSNKNTPRGNGLKFNNQSTFLKREDTSRPGQGESMKTEETNFGAIQMNNKPTFRLNNQQGGGQQEPVTVLMVAEKPSIAKTIAESLGNGRSRSRKGVSKFCQVHEFFGEIFGQKAFFKVTSVTGHIYVADFPPEYQDWRTVDPYTLFEAPTIKKEANPESQIIQHLQNEAKDVTFLVLWLDNDREGENICFEVLSNVREHMKQESFEQIFRVRFSSLVKQDIVEAFHSVNSGPNENESRSVDARQMLDLKIGVAFSRFQTRYLLRKYPNLNTRMITFGPCQTPTLGFCVQRDDEVKNFVSKPFYRIVPSVITPQGAKCEISWSNERTFSPEEAQQIKSEIEAARETIVIEAVTKDTIKGRPEALNTPQMLKLSSSLLGLGPQQTMQVAEKLYQQGFITYPRTESTSYPAKYNFGETVSNLREVPPLSSYCNKLLQQINLPKRGKDAGDHPPITPTPKVPPRGSLKEEEWKLYEFVSRHFLATISHDAKITNMSVTFQAGKHKCHLKGSRLVDRGFMEITPWVKVAGNEIPEFNNQQRLTICGVEIKLGKTTPPDHLTESDLITLMEKHGIGTDASMAQHINNICERNFVKVVGNNRKLVPTELGSALIHGYQQIDPDLVAPTLRSQIEQRVDMIAKGELDCDQVVQEVLMEFSEKFLNFKKNVSAMDTIFTESFGTFEDALAKGEPFSVCGQCGQQLLFVDKFNKLHCNNCNMTLSLPMNGKIDLAGDRCCPIDGFQLLTFTASNQITSYLICPMCSNNSPHPEISARLTCNLCPEAECPYSSVNSEIKGCDKCNTGIMVIDQQVGDKLTASCNYCTNKLTLAENISGFERDQNRCQCSAYLFTKIMLADGNTFENACVFCHPQLSAFTKPCDIPLENKEPTFEKKPLREREYQENNRRGMNNMESKLQRPSYKISKMEKPRYTGSQKFNGRRDYQNQQQQQQNFGGRRQNNNYNNFNRKNNGTSWKYNQFQQTG